MTDLNPIPNPQVGINSTTAYGTIITSSGVTAETTTDATPRKVAAWNANGLSRQMICDYTTSDITCVRGGVYMVIFTGSFSGSNSKHYHLAIYVDAVATLQVDRTLGAGGDVGSTSASGIIRCAAGQTISIYHWSTDGGSAFTMTEATLTAYRIGD